MFRFCFLSDFLRPSFLLNFHFNLPFLRVLSRNLQIDLSTCPFIAIYLSVCLPVSLSTNLSICIHLPTDISRSISHPPLRSVAIFAHSYLTLFIGPTVMAGITTAAELKFSFTLQKVPFLPLFANSPRLYRYLPFLFHWILYLFQFCFVFVF